MPLLLYLCLVTLAASYCPNEYTYYESTQKCYKVVEEPSTYFAAADACTLDDGQLVSIHNAFENTYVTSLIQNKYADHWIGLTSMIMGWNFTWLDNSVFSYDRFSPSPPNRDYNCVVMKAVSSTWATESCHVKLPYVCIFDPAFPRACPICPTSPPCPTCSSPPVCNPPNIPQNYAGPKEKSILPQVICPAGYTFVELMQRCYKVTGIGEGGKTFFAASNDCNLDDAELVSIHSLEEGQTIGGLLPLTDNDQSYWIGLTNLVNNWGQWTWLDQTAVIYDNWIDDKPDNNMSCTVLHSLSLQWTTQTCQLVLPYICEFDPTKVHNCPPCPTPEPCPVCPTYAPCPPPKCDPGWRYFDYTDFCYFIGNDGMLNGTQAVNACRAKGSYLASIHSDFENSFILNYEYSVGNVSLWIGLYRTGPTPANFANYDGTPVDYTHWDVGQPDNYDGDEYCTVMFNHAYAGTQDGYWNDVACDNSYSELYVCKKPSNK